MLDSADLEQTVKIETQHVLHDLPRNFNHVLNRSEYLRHVLLHPELQTVRVTQDLSIGLQLPTLVES